MPLLATSCYNKYYQEIDDLNVRVDTVKQQLVRMKNQTATLSSLMTMYNSYYYVTGYNAVVSLGDTIAYRISFSNDKSILVSMGTDGTNAVNGYTPVIGVRMYTDGYYYWTVTYNGVTSYIYDSSTHLKVRAGAVNGTDGINGADGAQGNKGASGQNGTDAITPQLKITDGYWYMSSDNGKTWTLLGQATGDTGTTFFKSVYTDSKNYVVFQMSDGTLLKFPSEALWSKISGYLTDINSSIALTRKSIEKLESMDYITGITQTVTDGDTIRTVSFKSGTVLTLRNGDDGKDAPAFTIGTKIADDGVYYWSKCTVTDTSFLLDSSGAKIRVKGTDGTAAISPLVTAKADTTDGYYYWAVSVNGGEAEFILDSGGNKIACDGSRGDSWIASVDTTASKDSVIFTLTGGSKVVFPTWSFHEKVLAAIDSSNARSESLFALAAKFTDDTVMIVSSQIILGPTSIVGYKVTFSDGSVFDISNGTNADSDSLVVMTPVIGISQYAGDGKYYWTVKYGSGSYSFILDASGNRILAIGADATKNGSYPIVGTSTVSGVDYWVIKVGTASYFITDSDGNRIAVTGSDGKASTDFNLFDSITSDDYFTYFTLDGGTVVKVLNYKNFNVIMDSYSSVFEHTAGTILNITIEGAYDTPQIESISNYFNVNLTHLVQDSATKVWTATLAITANAATSGEVLLFITDGMSKLSTKKLILTAD